MFKVPVKYEYVVFAKLSEFQASVYRYYAKIEIAKLAASKESTAAKAKGGAGSLKSITMFKKLVNHPALLSRDEVPSELIPPGFTFKECQPEYSGKMWLLEQMIFQMRHQSDDKIVLISNYTQTLDSIQKMCVARRWGLCRLDGSMSIQKRQRLVDQFNDPTKPEFIFLLSSKAGGCGINLVSSHTPLRTLNVTNTLM